VSESLADQGSVSSDVLPGAAELDKGGWLEAGLYRSQAGPVTGPEGLASAHRESGMRSPRSVGGPDHRA
jgi:hypothetical protein